MRFLGRNEESKILKVSALIFASWKMREEYRSSRDVGYFVPVWYNEDNSLIFPTGCERKALTGGSAVLGKERQKIRSEDLSWDTDTNPLWLLAQILKGEKKKEKYRGRS